MIIGRPAVAYAAAGLLLFGLTPLYAAEMPRPSVPAVCPTDGTQPVLFDRALSGDRFRARSGDEIRLIGVLAPTTPADAEMARNVLAAKLASGSVTITTVGKRDRYGRILALAYVDGEWVQASLLREGVLLASPDLASAPCAQALLAAEASGRFARNGQWRTGLFEVLNIEKLLRDARRRAGTFQIVEGRVVTASVVRGRAYLNFGTDYTTDFTVSIAPLDMREFRRARFDPRSLAGKLIRVRGWLELYNGPNMQIATPGAIEVLD